MGSIKRQGIGSGLFMYIGLIVGFANNLLFPRIIGEEVLGFTIWVSEMAEFLALLAGFGGNISIIRFFPYFKDREKGHNGYLGFLFVVRTAGLVLTFILILLFKELIINIYDRPGSREYIQQYYPMLLVALVLLIYSDLLENYLSGLLRPRIPTFFRDVVARLAGLTLIGLYFFHQISLEVFIIGYVSRLLVSVLGMLAFSYHIGELHRRMDWSIFRKPIFKEIVGYNFYSIFATLGSKITTKIDILMIPALLNLGAAGIYGVFSFFASVIIIPHNSMAKITSPILSDAWKDRDFDKIQELYRRTALDNFAVGVLIFVGIVINLDHIVTIIGPQFEVGKYVAVFLGLGQLAHTANGYNGIILNYSPQYRYDLAFKIATAVLNIFTNLLFIRLYGIVGAAMATALTIFTINCFTQWFVYHHFRMHPFSINMLGVIGAGLFCLLIDHLIPSIQVHFLLDLLLRSALVSILYAALIVGLRIVPDIADFTKELWQRYVLRK
ncbi:MAG TPA: oligosaccharide flippase family protein [Saprospiraceae bacterium]|nr:oligosaccharide flippase family protein [Saprospiraceae bacterium]HMQ83250.1 oligosaccharide flippase family protein [Saprospiraceae bacterium]